MPLTPFLHKQLVEVANITRGVTVLARLILLAISYVLALWPCRQQLSVPTWAQFVFVSYIQPTLLSPIPITRVLPRSLLVKLPSQHLPVLTYPLLAPRNVTLVALALAPPPIYVALLKLHLLVTILHLPPLKQIIVPILLSRVQGNVPPRQMGNMVLVLSKQLELAEIQLVGRTIWTLTSVSLLQVT